MVQGEPKKFSRNDGIDKKGNTDLTQLLKSGLARGSNEELFDSPGSSKYQEALMEGLI